MFTKSFKSSFIFCHFSWVLIILSSISPSYLTPYYFVWLYVARLLVFFEQFCKLGIMSALWNVSFILDIRSWFPLNRLYLLTFGKCNQYDFLSWYSYGLLVLWYMFGNLTSLSRLSLRIPTLYLLQSSWVACDSRLFILKELLEILVAFHYFYFSAVAGGRVNIIICHTYYMAWI